MNKYQTQIRFAITILIILVLFLFVGEVILPFLLGLFFAYISNAVVVKLQRFIRNRNLAVTTFLFIALSFSVGSFFFLGNLVVNDFKRLGNAFVTFSNDNSDQIDETTKTVKSYIEKVYPKKITEIPLDFGTVSDSLSNNSEMITKTLSGITSFFSSSDDVVKEKDSSYNWWTIIPFSLVYFLYILYTFPYFDDKFTKYLGDDKKRFPYLIELKYAFQNVMATYMKQRTIIVLICTLIFVVAFSIIGLPGAIILGTLAGLLCYASHFHYYVLLPLSLSCWVLSVEQDQSFFLYFGLVTAVFILVSVLEEFVFFPKIMKGVSNMNPAIMMLSFCTFNYLFGTIGILIALPLTAVLLIYLDKILILRKEALNQ
jgi:predicted PurR-regulated permease PerM